MEVAAEIDGREVGKQRTDVEDDGADRREVSLNVDESFDLAMAGTELWLARDRIEASRGVVEVVDGPASGSTRARRDALSVVVVDDDLLHRVKRAAVPAVRNSRGMLIFRKCSSWKRIDLDASLSDQLDTPFHIASHGCSTK